MKDVYIGVEEIYDQAEERLKDTNLQRKIGQYLGEVWPSGFDTTPERPIGVYAPYLSRGSRLEVKAAQIATAAGLDYAVATYEQSEYVTANPGLVDCYRAPLELAKGQKRRLWVVDEMQRPGAIAEATTVYGGNVVEYWGAIRNIVFEEKGLSRSTPITDMSGWYTFQAKQFGWSKQERSKSPYYYKALMGLYASGRAVLLDTPPSQFFDRVMAPAIRASVDALGVQPLIANAFDTEKRDWVDVSFLSEQQSDKLIMKGVVG